MFIIYFSCIDSCLLVGLVLFGAGGSWLFYARYWFTGPVINLSTDETEQVDLESDKKMFHINNDVEGTSPNGKNNNNGVVEVLQVEKVLQ